jgi:A/G-specific adenine glycosylase
VDDPTLPPAHLTHGRRALARKLLAWFRRSARDLPWRRTKDLYAIWISEVMLQQTQVATVVPHYHRFLSRFPDIASLAAAPEEQVLRQWEGLGYYRRARQLSAAARQIADLHGGRLPTSFDDLRTLPGIGRYTAGAILSIGLDLRLPILEANSSRVLSRLAAYEGDASSSAGQRLLWSLAEALLPSSRAGAFNQALMELGSEICTARSPACNRCPIIGHCAARAQRLENQIPPSKKTRYEDVAEVAVVVRRRGRVLVRKCGEGERWAGLWDFPRFVATDGDIAGRVAEQAGTRIKTGRLLTTIKHSVTRFRITLRCYEGEYVSAANRRPGNPIRWVTVDRLTELPLSVTGRRIARLLAETTPRKSPSAAAPRGRSRRKPG